MKRNVETLPHIKQVSRIKHAILERYFPLWAMILGSAHRHLCYFDCYAGRGRYEFQGEAVDGSPIIAVRAAKGFAESRTNHKLSLTLIEQNRQQVQHLESHLTPLQPYPRNLDVCVLNEDSETFVQDMLAKARDIAPSFFLIIPTDTRCHFQ